jgi:predicted nucleotidyltransferase
MEPAHGQAARQRSASAARRFLSPVKVTELSFFGSVMRDDFRPDSDVDVLVTFDSDAGWSLLDIVTMQDELGSILGRKVDLLEEAALRNPYRRSTILQSKHILYAS